MARLPVAKTNALLALFPAQWQFVIALAVVIAIIANANAWIMGYSRLLYSAGRERILPKVIGTLVDGTPRKALYLMSGFYAIVLSLAALVDYQAGDLMLLVTQNFIILYAVAAVAFLKVVTGFWPRLMGVLSLAVVFVLTIGKLNLAIAYPVILIGVGLVIYHWQKRHTSIY